MLYRLQQVNIIIDGVECEFVDLDLAQDICTASQVAILRMDGHVNITNANNKIERALIHWMLRR